MTKNRVLTFVTALAAVLLSTIPSPHARASDDEPDPITETALTATRIVTLDDQFVEVGTLVPEFGGLYLKGDALLIVVKDLERLGRRERKAKQAEFEGALREVFEHTLEGKASKTRLVPGRYSVLELQSWYRNFGELLALPGVATTDFDEVANRLRIVVTEDAPVSSIRDLLRQWRVPSEAVAIETEE